MAFIYQIKNLINGKIYIGSTQSSFTKRKSEHIATLKGGYHTNKHLQSSWNKYGKDNFSFEIIEELMFPADYSIDYIYEYVTLREIYYINLLNPQYNISRETSAGKLGRKLSEEERKKIGDRMRGRKHSEESKKKIREARARQIITEEHKRKIGEKSKGNKYNLGKKHSEQQKQILRERALENIKKGIGMHSSESKEKRTKTIKIIHNTPEMKLKFKMIARSRNKKPFLCFKEGKFIGEFLSQADTADLLNLKSSEICAVLRKEQRTTKGYSFIYKD